MFHECSLGCTELTLFSYNYNVKVHFKNILEIPQQIVRTTIKEFER